MAGEGVVARGVVRAWHEDEEWGVIESPATPGGCWVHASALQLHALDTLVVGQAVVFTWTRVTAGGYAHQAVRVRH